MELKEKLIQYLDKELSEEDIKEINELLAENPALREEKELYEQIILAIRKQGEQQLRTELDGYLQEHLDQNDGGRVSQMRSYWFYGGIAASLTLLLVLYYQSNTKSDQQMPIEFQIEHIPVHADSATFKADSDSLKADSIKILNSNVDK